MYEIAALHVDTRVCNTIHAHVHTCVLTYAARKKSIQMTYFEQEQREHNKGGGKERVGGAAGGREPLPHTGELSHTETSAKALGEGVGVGGCWRRMGPSMGGGTCLRGRNRRMWRPARPSICLPSVPPCLQPRVPLTAPASRAQPRQRGWQAPLSCRPE